MLIYYYIRSYWNIQESDAIIKVSYTVLESSGIIAILRQCELAKIHKTKLYPKEYFFFIYNFQGKSAFACEA